MGVSPTEHCVGDLEVRMHQQAPTNLGKNTSTLFKNCENVDRAFACFLFICSTGYAVMKKYFCIQCYHSQTRSDAAMTTL